ncbi:YdhK family protein [Pseudoclavibacter chungangensis]|uniref:YdhK family protein n=2 Tax=Pseudoclavibacter chungangensis TaxID=587635 RepID=A0A7J5BV23_9MICO|nr:YdhK family protein [Pseudoclavibacter chungangensis]KAB1653452.1 YdhK family protein [Pseudoclavibacter chungangensis]KAB1657348.1 YdhK family protein [Pseudoclavibacter chungangensis]
MTKLRLATVVLLLGGALALTGCADTPEVPVGSSPAQDGHDGHGGHGDMDHPMDGGPVPDGMVAATDPTYPVGTEVILTADHMAGMNGATATIVGAYDTYTYAVDYTGADGEAVVDHKWVVQEEIENAGDERLPDGSQVVLLADHMDGMAGATATIVSSTDETVYVVDYEADGMTMTNHKWVVESEIRPAG